MTLMELIAEKKSCSAEPARFFFINYYENKHCERLYIFISKKIYVIIFIY